MSLCNRAASVVRPSVCLSVCKLVHASRYFYHRHDSIATTLTHDGPQKGLHLGCAQGQGQGQRSRDTDTFLTTRRVVNYCEGEKILSPPQFQHCGGERPRRPRASDAFVNISASNCLERLVSEMSDYVSNAGRHSLTHSSTHDAVTNSTAASTRVIIIIIIIFFNSTRVQKLLEYFLLL